MNINRYWPYGAVAAAAWVSGAVVVYCFSPGHRASAKTVTVPVANVSSTVSSSEVNNVANNYATNESTTIVRASGDSVTSGTSKTTVIRAIGQSVKSTPIQIDSAVGHTESFQLTVTKGWPVVVVRATTEENVWYVQEPARPSVDNLFVCTAVFGNPNTPAGTQFDVAVFSVSDAEAAAQFMPGSTLPHLSEESMLSRVISVVRR